MPTTPAPPVVLDAEVFARVFVTMLVDALEARGRQIHPQSIVVAAPIAAPAVVKQGFWTHARHVDVLLLGLTMAIVLVILAAWLV